MVYGFAKQSGGDVQISSEPLLGTTVRLYVPVSEGDSVIEAEVAAVVSPTGRGERILVIEDDAIVRMLILETLAEFGYVADEAQDAKSATPRIEDGRRLDLLISDVGLPGGMNGRQIADYARTLRPGLKVLFITGYAEGAAVRSDALPPGMEMITKPFSVAGLTAKINGLLGRDS
jgi:CheY-like chemotaxis protein